MANLIKNQILKHLSKFTKNLNADKLNFSMLRGEGELASLELDENTLMELMDLPSWLRINKAVCNRMQVKVQWTKLKSQPLCISFDEVTVEVETCDPPREMSDDDSHIPSYSSGGKYGTTDRVVDGICLSINSVTVLFKSHAFRASLELSRVSLKSKTPKWRDADLQFTRLRHPNKPELLLFKELEWMTTRIEANAMTNVHNLVSTPLRLIANQAKIRIVIKKRVSDCAVLASRVKLFLDDLLWVLTDAQLRAAIVFARSLQDVIAKSAARSKMEASKKVQVDQGQYYAQQGQYTSSQMHSQQQQQQLAVNSQTSHPFFQCDIIETSYHLNTGRVDLHLCGAMTAAHGMSDEYSKLFDSGAMQITFSNVTIDHYPFHPAGGTRTHWVKSNENMGNAHAWNRKLLSLFWDEVEKVDKLYNQSTAQPPQPANGNAASPQSTPNRQFRQSQPTPTRRRATPRAMREKLLESCYIVRVEDFTFFRVSTADSDRRKPKKFLASDKQQLMLPREMSSIHLEYTEYYYPEGINYPVPHAAVYALTNPVTLTIDYLSVLWLHSFALKLFTSVATSPTTENAASEVPSMEHRDLNFIAVMPKLILPAEVIHSDQPDRPQAIQVQLSKVTATNCHLLDDKSAYENLFTCLQDFQQGHLFHHTSFPNAETDLVSLPSELLNFAVSDEKVLLCEQDPKSSPSRKFTFGTNSLKRDAWADVWFVGVDQFWAEFLTTAKPRSRPQCFVDNFPLSMWYCFPKGLRTMKTLRVKSRQDSGSSLRKMKQMYSIDSNGQSVDTTGRSFDSLEPIESADVNVMVQVHGKVQIQIGHYQFLFLMRLLDTMTKYQNEIAKITDVNLPKECCNNADQPRSQGLVNLSMAVNVEEVELALLTLPLIDRREHRGKQQQQQQEAGDAAGKGDVNQTTAERTGTTGTGTSPSPVSEQPSLNGDSPMEEIALKAPILSDTILNPTLEIPTITKSHSDSEILQPTNQELMPPPRHAPESLSLTQPTSPVRQRNDSKNDFKKSFGALASGLNFVKNQLQKPEDEDWELCSEKSFMSEGDDSEYYTGFNETAEMPAFDGRAETPDTSSIADTVDLDEAATLVQRNGPKQCLVSVFRIMYSESIVQVRSNDVSVKAQTQYVLAKSYGNTTADEFTSSYLYETRNSPSDILPRREHYPIKLRFDLGPCAEDACTGAGKRGYLHLRALDTALQLPMSAVTALTELLEDEMIVPGPCMHIEASNVGLALEEDRPPMYKNSMTPPPIELCVRNIVVKRGPDGAFKIQAKSANRDSLISDLSESHNLLSQENGDTVSPGPTSPGSTSPPTLRRPDSPSRPASVDSDLDSGKAKVTRETLLFQLLAHKNPGRSSENWKMEAKRLEREKKKLEQITTRFTAFEDECSEEGLTPLSLLDELVKLKEENRILIETVARQQDEIQTNGEERASLKSVILILENEIRALDRKGPESGC